MTYLGFEGLIGIVLYTLVQIGLALAVILPLLIAIAFLLLMDRKVWAAVQLRRGPNVVGPFGLLQSFADLIKFAVKEPLIPAGADKTVFLLAPLATATCALAAWAVIPVNQNSWGTWVIADLNVGILYMLAISSLGVYGIIMGGWASNSKYAFMGAIRSCAQMVSYEVSIGLVIITVLLCAGSLNMTAIVNAQQSGVGAYFGLPKSFLDWYWLPLFPMFAMVKAIVPRYRYDQLMRLGWKVFLPLSLISVVVVAGVLQYGNFV